MRPFVLPKHKFTYLMVSQLVLILAHPYIIMGGNVTTSIGFLSLMVFVAGAYAVSLNRKVFFAALALGIPTFIGTLNIALHRELLPIWLTLLMTTLFYSFLTVVVLYYVMKSQRVTADTLSGAISVYLLMGLTWVGVYSLIEHVTPGSFAGVHGTQAMERSELLYFSFTTLTTTGFGDILPITPQARSFTILESIAGVLYLSTLIARMVGLYIVHSTFSDSSRAS